MLCKMHDRQHCVLTGSGTTALWMAYSCVPVERPRILLPAILCLDPVLAVHYANRTPVFSDVLASNATIDPECALGMIEQDPTIGAVVAAHLYGNPADLSRLESVCRKKGVLLIEDAAQALGGSGRDTRLFGSAGDVAILSFGHTKILDVGAGGAFLTDDGALADRARRLHGELNVKPENEILANSYRELFYSIWGYGDQDRKAMRLFGSFPDVYRDLHLHRATSSMASDISQALRDLEREVEHRRYCARIYREGLDGIPGISFFETADESVPWRFSFCLPADRRDGVLSQLREAGYDASRWYPNVSDWTVPYGAPGKALTVADRIESEVVNLWVTGEYDKSRIEAAVNVVTTALSTL